MNTTNNKTLNMQKKKCRHSKNDNNSTNNNNLDQAQAWKAFPHKGRTKLVRTSGSADPSQFPCLSKRLYLAKKMVSKYIYKKRK